MPFSYGLLLTSNIRHYTMVLDLRHVIPSAEFSSGGTSRNRGGGRATQCPTPWRRAWMKGMGSGWRWQTCQLYTYFKAKIHQIRFPASVCSFVPPSVRSFVS